MPFGHLPVAPPDSMRGEPQLVGRVQDGDSCKAEVADCAEMFLYNVNRGVIKLVITNLHRLLKALLSGRDFFHLPSIPSHRFLDKNMLVCLDRIENCIMVGPAVANEYRLDVFLR